MNVVITNTAALNTGDAAILIATVDILRQTVDPNLDVTVHDQQPDEVRPYYPDFEFHPLLFDQIGAGGRKRAVLALLLAAALWHSPFRRACRRALPPQLGATLDRFAAADLIVSAGGTYLVPHYRILPKLLDLLVAIALRRPFVLFTQSLGPFLHVRRGWLLRAVLRRARVVLVRDKRSYHHLTEFGVPAERIAACADAAFALAPEDVDRRAAGVAPQELRQVAISVRDWPHFTQDREEGMAVYHAAVAALVQHVVERYRADVTFLSTCQGVGAYWTDDSSVAETIVTCLPKEIRRSVHVDRRFHTPRVLLECYGKFDLVVATRMHAAILALCAGVPVLPIAYEFKTTELFAGLGLGDFVQHIDTITGERLCQVFDRFVAARPAIREGLAVQIAGARRSALSAGWHTVDALRKERP